jgi:predicted Zn-dependent protease
MYDIISLLLILGSLTIIIFIIAKKFTLLANIDIENIPSVKEAKVKEKIISNRLKRNFIKWSSKIIKISLKTKEHLSKSFIMLFNKLHDIKDSYNKSAAGTTVNSRDKIRELYAQAVEQKNKNEFDVAEEKLIEIISLDSKNIAAFKMLGEIYLYEKKIPEARETFKHVLKISEAEEESAEIYYNLAIIEKESGKGEISLIHIREALEVHPNNPRYLDTMIEVGILDKNKSAAKEALSKLKAVNPENQKIAEFAEQIEQL